MSVPSNLVPTRILQLPEDPSPSNTGWMMYVNNGVTYKVQVNAVLNVSGVPTTRAIIAGTGLAGGGTLASNVTISVAPGGIGATQLDATGVGAGVYGDSANYPVITVDANGRITAATELAFPSVSGYVPTSRQVIAGIGLSGGGALTTNVTLDANLSNATPEPVGAETSGTSDNISRADHVHPAIDLADTQQTVNELDITRGGTGTALTSPANGGIVYSNGNSLQVSSAGTAGQVVVSTGAGAPTWGSAIILSDQPANYIYAGPTSGPSAPTAFRSLVNADLPASGVTANTYGAAATVPVFAVNSKGVLTGVTNTAISITNTNLQYSAITIGSTSVSLGSTITTFAGVSISGSTNTLTDIPNSALTNSSITINGSSVALGGSTTVTATASNALTIGTGLSGTSYNGSAPVTVAIDSTVATLTGVQTLTNKTLATPLVTTSLELNGPGVSSYTPFTDSLVAVAANFNGYREVYGVNLNNGSDASFDFVAYNDASDVNSYFIDMGMNSSNYTSTNYPIFTPNSGYLFTGGGLSGQQTDLFIGTSNPASDIIFFTGDVLVASQRAMFNGSSGNFLLNTATDTGYKFNNAGTSYLGGASTFGSTVTLHADPTAALQAATKQYVDNATSTGIHIHEQVYVEKDTNLAGNYVNGGTNANIIDISGGDTISFFSATPALNDQFYITSSSNGLTAYTAYYVVQIVSPGVVKVSTSYGGSILTGLTNGTPTIPTLINSGVGAYLEAASNAVLPITVPPGNPALATGDRVLVYQQSNPAENGVYTVTDLGSVSSKWKLTRATDADFYAPQDTNGMGEGDYFFITTISESYVLTTPGNILIGYTPLTYTLFSAATVYTGTSPINVTGSVISLTTVPATLGGTGTATVTTGDLLYGSAANTWSKLSLGSAYKSLVVNASGTQVEWNAVALNQASAVSGQLGVSNGGSGASTLTGYLKGNGTSAFTASSTIPNTDISGLGTMSTQNASSVTITGGTVNGTTIGGSTAAAGTFTTCTATTFSGIDGGTF